MLININVKEKIIEVQSELTIEEFVVLVQLYTKDDWTIKSKSNQFSNLTIPAPVSVPTPAPIFVPIYPRVEPYTPWYGSGTPYTFPNREILCLDGSVINSNSNSTSTGTITTTTITTNSTAEMIKSCIEIN